MKITNVRVFQLERRQQKGLADFPSTFATGMWLQEGLGSWGFQREAHALLVAGAELGRGGELTDGPSS
jgi:hypothetical protein